MFNRTSAPSAARSTQSETDRRAMSWTQRRRIASILRIAFKVMMKGKKRSVGALGRGAAVAAALAAMGVLTTPAMAQYAAGGATAASSGSVDTMGDRVTGGTLVFPTGNTSTTPTGIAVGNSTTKANEGSVAIGFHDVAGVTGNFPSIAIGIENQALGAFANRSEERRVGKEC